MSTVYKVGDKVRIVKRIGNGSGYRFSFVDNMAKLEGNIYKIISITEGNQHCPKIPDDGFCYNLEDSGDFSWASSMFELVEETSPISKEEPKVLDFTHKKKHYQLNFSV